MTIPKNILLLILIYFISLHADSGVLGGIVFLLTESLIPSIVNLLISYWVSFHLLKKISNYFIKIALLITISFLLGINFYLPDLWNYQRYNQPHHLQLTVINPLHLPSLNKDNEGRPILADFISVGWDKVDIKTSPFATAEVSGDEGCGCLYFKAPSTLSYHILLEKLAAILNQTGNKNLSHFTNSDSRTANYIMTHGFDILENHVLLKIQIKDRKGGHVILQATYPKRLYFSADEKKSLTDVSRGNKLSGKAFWKNATILFIHNNFWQWIVNDYFRNKIHIETPFDLLTQSDIKRMFGFKSEKL